MNITELRAEWEEDAPITDQSLLDQYSMATPRLHAKYCNYLSAVKMELEATEQELKSITHEAKLFYSGREIPPAYAGVPFAHKLLKTEIDEWVDVDVRVVQCQLRVAKLKIMKEYLTDVLRSIHNRSFSIGHAIDALKFYNGYSV